MCEARMETKNESESHIIEAGVRALELTYGQFEMIHAGDLGLSERLHPLIVSPRNRTIIQSGPKGSIIILTGRESNRVDIKSTLSQSILCFTTSRTWRHLYHHHLLRPYLHPSHQSCAPFSEGDQ